MFSAYHKQGVMQVTQKKLGASREHTTVVLTSLPEAPSERLTDLCHCIYIFSCNKIVKLGMNNTFLFYKISCQKYQTHSKYLIIIWWPNG